MKTYMVKHTVTCEVSAWRTIKAENYTDAVAQVAAIHTITAESNYEIVNDLEVKHVSIREI